MLQAFGQQLDTLNSPDCIYISDPVPEYPGGHQAMNVFIKKNLKYPKREDGKGKVFVQFTVSNEDGSLSDFKVMKGLAVEFDKNAIEVLKKMPNWIPAKGTTVSTHTKMVIAVVFDDY